MGFGAVPASWYEYRRGWVAVEAEVIEEASLTVYVNGQEVATLMASPREQEQLALGFLANEGLIAGLAEVKDVYLSRKGCCVDVWLSHAVTIPERVVITSGCGGGVTFDQPNDLEYMPLKEDCRIRPEALTRLFNQLQAPGSLYARARGVHAAGLSDGEQLVVIAEDVGRHNAVDKLLGQCLLAGIETRGRILLTTGRISSEMLRKGARMGCPIIASRNSPTSLSVAMAEAWNITLIGYIRHGTLRAYTHPERLGLGERGSVGSGYERSEEFLPLSLPIRQEAATAVGTD